LEIFRLWGKVLVDDSAAGTSLDRLDRRAAGVDQRLGAMIKTAARWAGGLLGAYGIVALVGRFTAASEAIDVMSQRTGISRTRLQELKFAAEQSDVAVESLGSAVSAMTRMMLGAELGGEAQKEAFDRLGVSIYDVGGELRATQDIFDETLAQLAAMEPGALRDGLAMKVFGRGASELLPLLNQGADGIAELSARAHELGLVLSDETIQANDKFRDTLETVRSVAMATGQAILGGLLPPAQRFLEWTLGHLPEIGTAFKVLGTIIVTTFAIRATGAILMFVTNASGALAQVLAQATLLVTGLGASGLTAATGMTAAAAGATVLGTAVRVAMGPLGIAIALLGALALAGDAWGGASSEVAQYTEVLDDATASARGGEAAQLRVAAALKETAEEAAAANAAVSRLTFTHMTYLTKMNIEWSKVAGLKPPLRAMGSWTKPKVETPPPGGGEPDNLLETLTKRFAVLAQDLRFLDQTWTLWQNRFRGTEGSAEFQAAETAHLTEEYDSLTKQITEVQAVWENLVKTKGKDAEVTRAVREELLSLQVQAEETKKALDALAPDPAEVAAGQGGLMLRTTAEGSDWAARYEEAVGHYMERMAALGTPVTREQAETFMQTMIPDLSALRTETGIPGAADGAYVPRTPGGRLYNLGEGLYDEMVIPVKPGMGLGGVVQHVTINPSFPNVRASEAEEVGARWGRGLARTLKANMVPGVS